MSIQHIYSPPFVVQRPTTRVAVSEIKPHPEVPVRASSNAFVFLLLWTTAGASAVPPTVTTQPAAPTHLAPVTIVIPFCCPAYDSSTIVRNGSTFDIAYYPDCVATCLPGAATYDVGPLPAGTYTVRHFVYDHPETAEVIGSFVVGAPGPATVPTLGASGLALLALLLVGSALLTLRRRISKG